MYLYSVHICMYVCVYIYIYMYVYIYIYAKTFAVRNWPTWWWSLTSLKTCRVSQQAGDQRHQAHDGVVLDQKPAGSRFMENHCFSLNLKTRKSQCPSLKEARQEEFCYLGENQPFSSTQGFSWLDEAHHVREGNLLHQSIDLNVNVIQRHSQRNVWPGIWVPCGSVKLT